jgi:predicted nucleic acid-binding protein
MNTALDTNIVSGIWSGEPGADKVAARLVQASGEGRLIVCGMAYAELLAYPTATVDFVDAFLSRTRVEVEFALAGGVWREAGSRFGAYCRRRRRAGAVEPKRLVADFVIGAHALLHADRLFTLDTKRYRRDFPELRLVSSL